MFVAPETFDDLEFFKCRIAGGKPVFKYIDVCLTDGGRAYLKRLLGNSPEKPAEILELQEITRFLSEKIGATELELPRTMHSDCEAYLDSNFIAFDLSEDICPFLKGFYLRARNPLLFSHIKNGIRLVLSSVTHIAEIFSKLRQQNPSKAVVQLLDEFLKLHFELGFEKIDPEIGSLRPDKIFSIDYQLRIKHPEKIRKLFSLIAKFDAHLSMGRATVLNGFFYPEIHEKEPEAISVRGLYHPFLENPVKNDFKLEKGRNFLFMTGPNMAGKTTYLKAVGIAMILAHAGMGVPAASMAFTPVDHLFFQLTVQDDLRRGISSFFQEISQVKRVTELIDDGKLVFVVIDEIFKGTNVSDAMECSKIVINGLAALQKHFFIISSHLYELETAISHNPNIVFGQFETLVNETGMEFPRRIIPGVSNTRIGTRLLETAGLTKYFADHNRCS